MSIHAVRVRRALLAALTGLLLAGGLSALPSTAAAVGISVTYCNQLVAPFSACPNYDGARFRSDNNSIYRGAQTRSVCQKVLFASDWSQAERICANNWATGTYAYYLSGMGWATLAFSGNNSQWTHTNEGETWVWASAARSATTDTQKTDGPRLRLSTIPADQAPAFAQRSISALRSTDSGKVMAIARVNDQVTLRTTREKLCLSASITGGEITCQDYDKTVAGDLIAAVHCGKDVPDDTIVLYGVVPDGITAVSVLDENGASIARGDVSANTFRIDMARDVARAARSLDWGGKAGSKTLDGIVGADAGC